MHKFDYSFLADGLLPANLVNLTANIASLSVKSAVRKADFKNVFASLEGIAKVQSVKSSNAIEGIITSDERIAAIVHHNSAPLNHDEAEIAGYRDALNEIHLYYNEIPFSVSSISLFLSLFKFRFLVIRKLTAIFIAQIRPFWTFLDQPAQFIPIKAKHIY
mgnify:CR=1 FL=1